ncbi:MAG: TonB-dependent receptor, partial [Rhodospirillaceae bacterium]
MAAIQTKPKGETMNRTFYKSALYVTTALLSVMGSAFAESDAPEEIVVTARRVEERLQDVPISITVYSQQQLSNRNVTTASDLATFTPSLSTDARFGQDNSSFSIRGFTQEFATQPSVGVYFADVVAPRSAGGVTTGNGAGPGAFFDLQNVQVLKGPQGTLFGRNTTGGAVLLVPNKPTADFGGYVEASYGNYNMERVQAVINTPLSDKVRFRAGVDQQKRDGYMKNISGIGPSAFADVNYYALRASLVVDVTPDVENYTIATFSRSKTNGDLPEVFACNPKAFLGALGLTCPEVARLAGKRWTVENNFPNPEDLNQQWQVINTTTWNVSDRLTATNIASYSQTRSVYRSSIFGDNFSFPAAFPGIGGLPLQFVAYTQLPGVNTAYEATYTEELRLSGRTSDNRLTWQVGGYLENSDPVAPFGGTSAHDADCTNTVALQCIDVLSTAFGFPGLGIGGGVNYQQFTTSFRDLGVYGQASYSLTDKLKVTGGLRYTADKTFGTLKEIIYQFPASGPVPHCPAGSTATLPDCLTSASKSSHAPTWLIDLEYSPMADMMLYGKYTRGYREGSIILASPPGFNQYNPEKVDTYELGAKTSFQGAISGTFNLSAFYNDFTNQQIQVAFVQLSHNLAQGGTTGIVNAGKSRIWGTEVESSLNLFKGFRLDTSYAYLNSLLQTLNTGIVPVGFAPLYTSIAGDPLPLTPKHKLSLTGNYTLPLDESLGKISVAANWVYTSSVLTAALAPTGIL